MVASRITDTEIQLKISGDVAAVVEAGKEEVYEAYAALVLHWSLRLREFFILIFFQPQSKAEKFICAFRQFFDKNLTLD